MDEVINDLISIAKRHPYINRMWLFGSRYKETHKTDSDLDLAVEVVFVKGCMLGCGEESLSLWCAASSRFKDELKNACPWELDLQGYAGEKDTPHIHKYLNDGSKLIYEKGINGPDSIDLPH
ncbi:hypothetical protein MNBD_GAMMA26-2198 [hydrothermal vent metagenome]|uniref:Polymerase beta nucleotidyltransferase domain-containing protein n=1 Tax=hydrothermal vent metagenome TaxID=652676 RepID=A0A3B1BAE5_9ZZZZ